MVCALEKPRRVRIESSRLGMVAVGWIREDRQGVSLRSGPGGVREPATGLFQGRGRYVPVSQSPEVGRGKLTTFKK